MAQTEIPDTEQDATAAPSKSQRKREMAELQRYGESLLNLPARQLAEVPMSIQLTEALSLAANLKQREARRRQLQYIGKLMRNEDIEAIRAVLDQHENKQRYFRQHFQRLENLRDRLITGSNQVLAETIDAHPNLDRQHLRQLIRQARKEAEQNKSPAASRKLFRYLREQLFD